MNNWMIYGASGYSGKLIVEECKRKRLNPILAGRNETQLKELADKYGFEFKVFTLNNFEEIEKNLTGIHTLLNCAGPFSKTFEPLFTSCLKTKTNYLDITGEIEVFQKALEWSDKALAAGISVIPGVGFYIIPTDCLALQLKEKLPDAIELDLAFKTKGNVSRGTAKTMLEGLSKETMSRQNGKLIKSESFSDVKSIRFNNKLETAVAIPWSDIYTAYFSTQVPNIKVFVATPAKNLKFLKIFKKIGAFVGDNKLFLKIGEKMIDKFVKGDSEMDRSTGKTYFVGLARNKAGETQEIRFTCKHAYDLTADVAVEATLRVLDTNIKKGFSTPSIAFGSDFINKFVTL